jgi:hypothetical protein
MCHQLKAGEHKLLDGYGPLSSWSASSDSKSEETR